MKLSHVIPWLVIASVVALGGAAIALTVLEDSIHEIYTDAARHHELFNAYRIGVCSGVMAGIEIKKQMPLGDRDVHEVLVHEIHAAERQLGITQFSYR